MRDGLRRPCEALVDSLAITAPFDAVAFCEKLGAARGRPIRRLPRALTADGVYGMWVATRHEDLIVYESRTSPPHQDHIMFHELGHLLCGHEAAPITGHDAALMLLPDLDPAVVERVLRRTQYSAVEEREAELVASLILQRVALSMVARLRAYRELEPLWWAVYQQMPGLVLNPPRSRWTTRWIVRDVRHRLYRRVIEVEDGRFALREDCDARVADAAGELGRQAGLPEGDLLALQEAAVLAAALRSRKELGSRPAGAWTLHSEADLAAQTTWLRQVSRAFDGSPAVRALTSPIPNPASNRGESRG